jgi:hypothetical protein
VRVDGRPAAALLIVVIGLVVASPSRDIAAQGPPDPAACRTIHTVHEVDVAEDLKGGVPRGARIAVTMAGGRVDFGGGLGAEIRADSGGPIVDELPHLFFLRPVRASEVATYRHASGAGTFAPSHEPQGVYRLTSRVESLAADDPLRSAYDALSPPMFLAAVRQAVADSARRR